jgi:hypothetical protein
MPIIMSRFMGADLNTLGVYDNATKTKTGYLIVARDSWYNYNRRQITVETDKDIASGAIRIVSTMRGTFDSPDAAATKNVAYHYNIGY